MSPYQTYFLIGKCLALDILPSHREHVLAAFKSGTVNWNLFVQTASNQLVLQSIYPKLSKHNLLEYLPPDLADYLQTIHFLNTERNAKILEQAKEINTSLNQQGIHPIYLKGVGNLLDGLYPDPGERIIQDIDLLVGEDEFDKSVHIMLEKGYAPHKQSENPPVLSSKHYPRLFKKNLVASLEIHKSPVKKRFTRYFHQDLVIQQKTKSLLYPDLFVMSNQHKLIHNFMHSQIDNLEYLNPVIFMRSLYDFVLISEKLDSKNVIDNFNAYRKQFTAYSQVSFLVFGLQNDQPQHHILYSKLYVIRFKLIKKSKFFRVLSLFLYKITYSYYIKPVRAIFDKDLRNTLLLKMKSRQWLKNHIDSYKKLFRTLYSK